MVTESVDVLELLRKQASGADIDFLREAVAVLAEAVMDHEVSAQVGAGYGERSEMRTTRRNGYRPRRWDTRVGSIDLQIPKLRQGSYFPALLEPRRRAERALLAVVQQAYVEGVLHTPRRRPRALARLRGHLEEPGPRVSARSSTRSSRASSAGPSTPAPTATSGSTRSPSAYARRAASPG